MKKTDMMILVSMTSNTPIYRTIFEDKDGHYWIKWNGITYSADKDVETRSYRLKGAMR